MQKSIVALSLSVFIFLVPCTPIFAQQKKRTTQKKTTGVVTQPKQVPVATTNESQNKQKPLTNADIIRMVKGGFSESIIINAIQTSETQFDVSMNALFELKNAGVSQKIIEAMQISVANRQLQQQQIQANTTTITKTTPQSQENVLSISDEQLKNLPQPYVLRFNQNKRTVLPRNVPTIVQTKAKGNDMATILADNAINIAEATIFTEASNAVAEAAGKAMVSTGSGIATTPILYGATLVIMKIPGLTGLKRSPTFTFLYALEGRQSKNVFDASNPSFEIFYGDVVGANPDEFEPALIKINPTPNNWRLVSAQKAKAKFYQLPDKNDFNVIEEIIPSRIKKLGRGNFVIEPQQPLSSGEYGIVIRPISKTYKMSYQDIIYRKGEGLLLGIVWDFSVSDSSANTQSTISTPQQNLQTSPKTTDTNTISNSTNTNSVSDTQALPVYGTIADIKSYTRIYVYAEDAESRERIIKSLKDAPQLQIVGNPQEAQIILEYKVLSRDSNMDRGDKDIRVKSQLSAIYINSGKRVVAWSDTAEYTVLTSGGIGFRTQHNETKLTERFIKAMKK